VPALHPYLVRVLCGTGPAQEGSDANDGGDDDDGDGDDDDAANDDALTCSILIGIFFFPSTC
jgi:hypothetical protein